MKILEEKTTELEVKIEFSQKEILERLKTIKIEFFEIHNEIQKGWLCVCINFQSISEDLINKIKQDITDNKFTTYYQSYIYGFSETEEEAFKYLLEKTKTQSKLLQQNLDLLLEINMKCEQDKLFEIIHNEELFNQRADFPIN